MDLPKQAPPLPDVEEIAFVFEVTRHGARAPFLKNKNYDAATEFQLGPSMLTPSGMRQRMLLGRRNRKRYIESKSVPSEVHHGQRPAPGSGEIFVQSTDVARTLQSAYAELSGLLFPKDSNI